MDEEEISTVELMRQKVRTALRDVNDLIAAIERHGLPEGSHAIGTALRQRLDDLASAIDEVLNPAGAGRRSPTAPPGAAAPVDGSVLAALLADLHDPARVAHLVQLFLTELHGRRAALTAAADGVDMGAAKAVAHTLKSSALLLGATPLGRACEALGTNDQPAQLRMLVDDVLAQATAAARWFQIWLSHQPVGNP